MSSTRWSSAPGSGPVGRYRSLNWSITTERHADRVPGATACTCAAGGEGGASSGDSDAGPLGACHQAARTPPGPAPSASASVFPPTPGPPSPTLSSLAAPASPSSPRAGLSAPSRDAACPRRAADAGEDPERSRPAGAALRSRLEVCADGRAWRRFRDAGVSAATAGEAAAAVEVDAARGRRRPLCPAAAASPSALAGCRAAPDDAAPEEAVARRRRSGGGVKAAEAAAALPRLSIARADAEGAFAAGFSADSKDA